MEAVQIEAKKGPPRSDSQKLVDEDAESVGKKDRTDRLNKTILSLISLRKMFFCKGQNLNLFGSRTPGTRTPDTRTPDTQAPSTRTATLICHF